MTKITPGEYLGKGIKLIAYVKTANVKNWVGLWMRVNGAGNQSLSFDNMEGRPIIGTREWQKYEIILDIPENSTAIFYGILLSGTGEAWVGTGNAFPLRVFRSTDQERHWIAVNTLFFNTGNVYGINTITFKDSLTGFAGGFQRSYSATTNNLIKTTDGGRSWTVVSSFLPISPSTLVYVPQTNNSVSSGLNGADFCISNDGLKLVYDTIDYQHNIYSLPIHKIRVLSLADATPITNEKRYMGRGGSLAISPDFEWISFNTQRTKVQAKAEAKAKVKTEIIKPN